MTLIESPKRLNSRRIVILTSPLEQLLIGIHLLDETRSGQKLKSPLQIKHQSIRVSVISKKHNYYEE